LNYAGDLDPMVKQALELRTKLESAPIVTVRDAEEKERLHQEAVRAIHAVEVMADLVVGAAWSTAGQPQKSQDTRLASVSVRVRQALDLSSEDRGLVLEQLASQGAAWLNEGRPIGVPIRRPLHWPLAFPEVFADTKDPGFDAMVGNPPYIGNKYWKERVGPEVQPFFADLLGSALGKPDIIVLFLWRMLMLIRRGGSIGCLATQSMTEVDSKKLVQRCVLKDAQIYRAVRARPWPGDAHVNVSELWVARGWSGPTVLDGVVVEGIGADLRESLGDEPSQLAECFAAFEGVHNARGLALVVPAEDPLSRVDPFRPYVSGDDLAQHDPRVPSRYVLDLTHVRDEGELADLPAPVRTFLFGVVRPTRTAAELESYKGLAQRWWTFWNTREDGFASSREHPSCIVVPAVSKYLLPFELPSQWVYTNKVVVICRTRDDVQVLLLSPAFDVWAGKYGGSMMETRVMKISSVLRTFPLPEKHVDPALGHEWQEAVLAAVEGLGNAPTDVLNLVHDRGCETEAIQKVRETYQRIHGEVVTAYGWTDLQIELRHHEVPNGVRYGTSDEERLELLRRLVSMNHERSAAEGPAKAGRRATGIPRRKKQVAKLAGDATVEPTLFGDNFQKEDR
jgi:hypothetical protein